MSKKNIIIIASILFIGVATVAVVKCKHDSKNTSNPEIQTKEAARPGPDGVYKIYMVDKENNHVLLTYQSDSLWLVDEKYPANQYMIEEMLLKTLENMCVKSKVNNAAVENITKQIAAKHVKVEIYYRDSKKKEQCKVIYVGPDTQDNMATYMYLEGSEEPCIVHLPGFRGCLSPRFVVDPYLWRSHNIVNLPIRQISSVELRIPSMPEESFSVVREGNGFVFNKLYPKTRVNGFDTARVAQLLSSFTNLNFDEYAKVVPKAELDTTFSREPRTILRVTDLKGKTRELKTYIKYSNPDDIYAMPDTTMYNVFDLNRLYAIVDNKDTVLIQYYIFDNILQPASFFLGREKNYFAR
ncbi:MAG: DUF4340 domain-containing protein [Bacteroidales bacterium]|nr:DUF4340 domain-containing protein [Bacteroidales bacterium]